MRSARLKPGGPGRPAAYMSAMDPSPRHGLINSLQSILLIGGMAVIVWICAEAILGGTGALWALAVVAGLVLVTSAGQSEMVLSMYRARPVSAREFPDGVRLLEQLAERAGLSGRVALYYVPSRLPNAFATRTREHAAVAVSDGLLRLLNGRELAGVLAHEVSHVANRDLWIMGLADVMSRLTSLVSWVGQILLIVNLPLILMGSVAVPWTVPLLLIFAPTIMSLLQLALSRTREFDADLGAARLTGDPAGLASALAKLERRAGRFWEEILLPGRRIPEPSLLRTHPKTQDRIARLRELDPEAFRPRPTVPAAAVAMPWPRVAPRPRWHRTGVWY